MLPENRLRISRLGQKNCILRKQKCVYSLIHQKCKSICSSSLKEGGGGADPTIRSHIFESLEIRSNFASKSESDMDILRRVGGLPLTSSIITEKVVCVASKLQISNP